MAGHRSRRHRRVHPRACRRRSASHTGTLGTADACTRTCIPSQRESPRHVIVSPAINVTSGLRQDASAPTQRGRRGDARDHRGAATRVLPLRHHPKSTMTSGVDRAIGAENPRTPGRFPAAPTWRWPSMASTSSRPTRSSGRSEGPTPRPATCHDFSARIHHGAVPAGAGPIVSVLRREQEGGQVLGVTSEPSTLFPGQHGPLPRQPGVQPVRPGVADADPTSRRRPPAKFVVRRGRPAEAAKALDSVVCPACISRARPLYGG